MFCVHWRKIYILLKFIWCYWVAIREYLLGLVGTLFCFFLIFKIKCNCIISLFSLYFFNCPQASPPCHASNMGPDSECCSCVYKTVTIEKEDVTMLFILFIPVWPDMWVAYMFEPSWLMCYKHEYTVSSQDLLSIYWGRNTEVPWRLR